MKKTINKSDFVDEWNRWEDRKNTFSYEGKIALFDYLTEYEESTGEQVELDIIALCCDYTEYENLKEYNEAYNTENPFDSLEEVEENTQVIRIENSDAFIIANY